MPAVALTRARAAIELARILTPHDWARESDIREDTGLTRTELWRASNLLIEAGIKVLCRDDLWSVSIDSWQDLKDYASRTHRLD